jgi:hypothetical protein
MCDNCRMGVIKSTSAHLTYRCMPTSTAKTRQLFKKDSSVFVPPRTAIRLLVCSPNRKLPTFTVDDQDAVSRSKTSQTWVRKYWTLSRGDLDRWKTVKVAMVAGCMGLGTGGASTRAPAAVLGSNIAYVVNCFVILLFNSYRG